MNPKTQQALTQFVESMLITALIAAIFDVTPMVSGSGSINWQVVGVSFFWAFVVSAAHSFIAYMRPTQPDLSAALDGILRVVEQRLQVQQQPVQGPLVVVHQPAQAPAAPVVVTPTPAAMPVPPVQPTTVLPIMQNQQIMLPEDTMPRAVVAR